MTTKKLLNSRVVLVLCALMFIILAIAESKGNGTALVIGLVCALLAILVSVPTKNQQ